MPSLPKKVYAPRNRAVTPTSLFPLLAHYVKQIGTRYPTDMLVQHEVGKLVKVMSKDL